VEHFEAMTPGNSVKELEGFIDTTLATVTPENCQERLPRRTGDSRDFFLQSRARAYDAVRKRCSQFVEERLLDSYDRLAQRFNKTLAGRFPFSRNPSSLDEEEANPRDVRAFFAEYDQFLPRYDALVGREEAPGLPAMAAAMRGLSSFMEGMRSVRPFFAPLLNEKSSDVTPKYNLMVEYRVNRTAEINGNQIAEWSMALNDARIDDTQLSWSIGEKLRLSMRWAKDGPYHPAANDQVKGATVDGTDSIHFEWGGYWGILRFLRIHRSLPSDLRKAVDRQPHILKFIVEITERKRTGRLRLLPDSAYNRKEAAPTTAAKSAFIFTRAVVFVRFALSVSESKDAILVPADWPVMAPLSKDQEAR
jgi:type VI secretion system protein ImpL